MNTSNLPYDLEDISMSAEELDSKYNPEGDGEHPAYTRQNWTFHVSSGHTLLGYWEWVSTLISEDDDEPPSDNEEEE